jgi:hypothetical protein
MQWRRGFELARTYSSSNTVYLRRLYWRSGGRQRTFTEVRRQRKGAAFRSNPRLRCFLDIVSQSFPRLRRRKHATPTLIAPENHRI